ncbi:MAG: hypothetical protein IPJ89_00010 [Candidatus Iainarchaeum archaeon]|uniref:Uncharacterized protein n=1 Tax=Candidatus Iainarchaeum sp. TaxID=3101447 RepID=A0A7T9I215_9ARCH|nr:MAG: hypothetical protein IPJ89_00010 [Candidatus Diapherotrites archaeon]
MAKKDDKRPGKVAGKVIRKQLKGVKSDVQEVKSGVTKQVKSVKSDVKAVKTNVAEQTKAVKSATKAAKAVNKGVSREVKAVKSDVKDVKSDLSKGTKRLSKSLQKSTKKLSTQSTEIKEELEKLKEAISGLKTKSKKPVEKRELSMYNLFIRQQIRSGKTFEQSVAQWKKSKKILANPETALAGKTRTITKTKTIIKRVPVTKTRTIVKKVPVVKTRTIIKRIPATDPRAAQQLESLKKEILGSVTNNTQMNAVRRELSAIKDEMHAMEKDMSKSAMPQMSMHGSRSESKSDSRTVSEKVSSHTQKVMEMVSDRGIPDEQVAAQLVKLYFEEIARLGFKRSLDFDSIINAYFYCLQRLKHREKELEVMRRIVEKEESKITGETKTQLFPTMKE